MPGTGNGKSRFHVLNEPLMRILRAKPRPHGRWAPSRLIPSSPLGLFLPPSSFLLLFTLRGRPGFNFSLSWWVDVWAGAEEWLASPGIAGMLRPRRPCAFLLLSSRFSISSSTALLVPFHSRRAPPLLFAFVTPKITQSAHVHTTLVQLMGLPMRMLEKNGEEQRFYRYFSLC